METLFRKLNDIVKSEEKNKVRIVKLNMQLLEY